MRSFLLLFMLFHTGHFCHVGIFDHGATFSSGNEPARKVATVIYPAMILYEQTALQQPLIS